MSYLSYRTGKKEKKKKKETKSKPTSFIRREINEDYRHSLSASHLDSIVNLLGDISIDKVSHKRMTNDHAKTQERVASVNTVEKHAGKSKWPSILYAKKANKGCVNEGFLGLVGKRSPPVVFAIEDDMPDWDVSLVMNLDDSSKILDERGNKVHIDLTTAAKKYDALVRIVGVPPTRTVWRIFNRNLIKEIRLLSPNRHSEATSQKWVPVDPPSHDPEFVSWEHGDDKLARHSFLLRPECDYNAYTINVSDALHKMFGDFYDPNYDVIDVESCARRLEERPGSLADKIINTFSQCEVFQASGCWLSPQSATYRKVALWKYNGFRPIHLFSHSGNNFERHVVRHHPTRCELFIHDGNHSKCCRPSHLCYGSCKANSRDMELRRAVSTFVSLVKRDKKDTWEDVQKHVDSLANLLRVP